MTAVEWLQDCLTEQYPNGSFVWNTKADLEALFNQAKEMENQQQEQKTIDEDFDGGLTMGQIILKEETICIQTGLPCGMTCFSEEVCNRNVYTEEDVKNAFLDGWQLRDGDLPFPKAKKKWFNEFKNK